MGVKRFTDLRAWQACDLFKKAVYRLCREGPLSLDFKLRSQLEDAAAGPPRQLAEGFGRFNPRDFARFAVMARASLMECQNHLLDAVDRGHIPEQVQIDHDQLAQAALQETTGLMEYLQSTEAQTKARRARENRINRRDDRQSLQSNPNVNPNLNVNPEPANLNPEPPNMNPEPNLNTNREVRTKKFERRGT